MLHDIQNTLYELSLAEAGFNRKDREDSDQEPDGNAEADNADA